MNRTILAVLIAAGLALAFTPTAQAAPPGTCDLVKNTMCHVPGQLVKDVRDWAGEPGTSFCSYALGVCVDPQIQDPYGIVAWVKDTLTGPCTCPPMD